jgi:UDP-glucuronate 4-epimerase
VKEQNLAEARSYEAFHVLETDLVKAELAEIFAGSHGVFHLAAQPGVRGSWGETFVVYERDNVLATQRVFEAARASGTRVVFASSSSVYGNTDLYPTREDAQARPVSPYGVTKLTCELLAHAYGANVGLDFTALRYFTVYGPRQRPDMAFAKIIDALLIGEVFAIYGSGEQTRDATYVEDAVAATVEAMDVGTSGTIYNVGGGSEVSLAGVIETLESLAGRRLETERAPAALGDVRRSAADIRRARADLGWRPQVSLQEGLARQLEWTTRPPSR